MQITTELQLIKSSKSFFDYAKENNTMNVEKSSFNGLQLLFYKQGEVSKATLKKYGLKDELNIIALDLKTQKIISKANDFEKESRFNFYLNISNFLNI